MIASRMQDDLKCLDELVAEAGPDTRGADLLLSARATLESLRAAIVEYRVKHMGSGFGGQTTNF